MKAKVVSAQRMTAKDALKKTLLLRLNIEVWKSSLCFGFFVVLLIMIVMLGKQGEERRVREDCVDGERKREREGGGERERERGGERVREGEREGREGGRERGR